MKNLQALSLALLGGIAAARGDLLVYDGFNYEPGGNVLTPLSGGIGFADPWARAEEGANDSITVHTGAPGAGSLDGVFNNPAVVTSPPGAANRYIDGASGDDRITALRKLSQSAGTMAGADKVLWASVVWTMNGSNFGRQVGFALGTDGLRNRSQNISTNTTWGGTGAGNAIGVGGAINSQAVTPTIWSGGNQVVRTTTGAKNLSNSYDNIVILKYVFADGTAPDRVYAWAFGENETISETAFQSNAIFAEAVVNQDTLDILSFGQSQVGVETIDEIRLGDTFADVTSALPSPPEPLEFTEIVRHSASDEVTLTWKSNPGERYGLYWSADLVNYVMHGTHHEIPAHATERLTTLGPIASPLPNADKLFFLVGPPDLSKPALSQAFGSGNTVTLRFSEAIHPNSAGDLTNFSVTVGGVPIAILGATLDASGKNIVLTLNSPLQAGTSYDVTAQNITTLAGRVIPASFSRSFQTWDNDPNGIQVFVLAGQSNMVGHGKAEDGNGNVPGAIGCLRYLAVNDASYPDVDYSRLLVNPAQPATSAWKQRTDVKIWWRDSDLADPRAVFKDNLRIGFSQSRNPTWYGPEYGFGWAVGEALEKPVLIIKTAWGGKSLHVDFRPPGAVAKRGGVVGPYYTGMIEYVRDCLSNLATEFPAAQHPEFAAVGYRYRVAGFGWHQGWNDRVDATASAAYELNLVDLINDLRAEFGSPGLPVSITTTGMDPPANYTAVELAQLAMADAGKYPQFQTNVRVTDTRPFWRVASVSPSNFGYHWNHNGESQYLNGTAMGRQMVEMLTAP